MVLLTMWEMVNFVRIRDAREVFMSALQIADTPRQLEQLGTQGNAATLDCGLIDIESQPALDHDEVDGGTCSNGAIGVADRQHGARGKSLDQFLGPARFGGTDEGHVS